MPACDLNIPWLVIFASFGACNSLICAVQKNNFAHANICIMQSYLHYAKAKKSTNNTKKTAFHLRYADEKITNLQAISVFIGFACANVKRCVHLMLLSI